jgi:folate-binding protein YgfZ
MTDSTTDNQNTAWHDFLSEQGAVWDGEQLRSFHNYEPLKQPWLIPLEHQRLLRVTGADAEKFLQGQITCDIRRLTEQEFLLGAHCDHKGRMHSSFVAAAFKDASIGLRLHTSIATSAQAALQKYSVFFKTQIAVATDIRLFALIGAGAEEAAQYLPVDTPMEHGQFAVGDGLTLLRHGHTHFELWVAAEQAERLWHDLLPLCTPAAPEQWDLVHIEMGLGQVRAETVSEFIPQMLNLQSVDGISFDKGCYTGQEVVARMHYLGKLKKHMYRASVETSMSPAPGMPLYAGDKAAGQVVMAAAAEDQKTALLVVCSEQTLEEPSVTLGSASGPKLQWQPLPYAVGSSEI